MKIREAEPADIPAIVSLYYEAKWLNYTNKPSMLDAALRQSLMMLVAAEAGEVIGVIRAVGDGASILYIQDIIVKESVRRRGVGTRLLHAMDALYPDVYQKVLLTDDRPQSRLFYENSGYTDSRVRGCVAMMKTMP